MLQQNIVLFRRVAIAGGILVPTFAGLFCFALLAFSAPLTQGKTVMQFSLTSLAFTHGQPIPRKYSCDGENISPPLQWTQPHPAVKSFVLIADDPDAPRGTWVHWVLYNMPATTSGLPEGIPTSAKLSDGSLQGNNSWPKLGYGGPCPPSGTHRYYFKLYALDTPLPLDSGATKEDVLAAMQGHILAHTELMGTYRR